VSVFTLSSVTYTDVNGTV